MSTQSDRPRLAFLHTSPVHVATFQSLVDHLDPFVAVSHLVDEPLLADAQRLGADEASIVVRVQAAMTAASSTTSAGVVVCTCSTIGGAAERTPTAGDFTAMRIDRAMADEAIALGPRILVLAALESTLAPTERLLRESALGLNRSADVSLRVVAGAWPYFVRGDHVAYLGAIADEIRSAVTPATDAVVLAQASMADATALLGDLGTPVLSSPRAGVRRALARVRERAAAATVSPQPARTQSTK